MGLIIDALLGLSLAGCVGGLVAYQIRDRRRGDKRRYRGDLPELS